eukprot:Anaeramoba_ignava/a351520_12.p1 GENE.a351520_12~~a351520_12.p1  ORF type:complete len:949 (+),score=295.63 a351520_12:14-2860(+)
MINFSLHFVLISLFFLSTNELTEVFIVPHSHNDPGWLNTLEEYYKSNVSEILTNTMNDLIANPKHKFIYVENVFFQYWWKEQNEEMKSNVIKLIEKNQFEFVHGGYVMNDEAIVNYDMIINQMTIGHQWIKENIGDFAIPKIAFHVDPFGSSNMSPYLFSQMCFDAFVIDRIPWETKKKFMKTQHMEFIWKGSSNWGQETQMLTHVCPQSLYSSPIPFNWEHHSPLNEEITDENLVKSVDMITYSWKKKNSWFLHNYVLYLFGGDFEFQDPEKEFRNMDKLVEYINSNIVDYGVLVHYSTLSEYFERINKNKRISYPVIQDDDFLPYCFRGSYWWTGFFTSWPVLKGMIQSANANLFSTEISNILYNPKINENSSLIRNILPLRNAVAIGSHHDAITGTSTPDVNQNQYIRDLLSGEKSAQNAFLSSLSQSFLKWKSPQPTLSLNQSKMELLLSQNKSVPILLFNALGWTLSNQILSFNLSLTHLDIEILGPDSKPVRSIYDKQIQKVSFVSTLPPLGFTTHFIRKRQRESQIQISTKITRMINYPAQANTQNYIISNKYYSLSFSGKTGFLNSIESKITNKILDVENNIFHYSSNRSGAYIFHPLQQAEPFSAKVHSVTYVSTDLYEEIHQQFASNIIQIWRIFKTDNRDLGNVIELEHKLGPNLQEGQEIVTRFESSINSEGILYHTNNNLEIRKRIYRNTSISENYYPFSSSAWIQDSNQRLTFITDSPHGIASLKSGNFEIMIARSTLQDDECGLNMSLSDSTYFSSKIWIIFDSIQNSEKSRHLSWFLLNNPIKIAYAITPNIDPKFWIILYSTRLSSLCVDLPKNVHLLSLMENEYSSSQGILRFHHLYEKDNHQELSQSVNISLSQIFSCPTSRFHPKNFQETTLSLLTTPEKCLEKRMNWDQKRNPKINQNKNEEKINQDHEVDLIELKPMQIRTFIFEY